MLFLDLLLSETGQLGQYYKVGRTMSHLSDAHEQHACLARLTFGASCFKSEIIGCYKYFTVFRKYSLSYLLGPSEVWQRQL